MADGYSHLFGRTWASLRWHFVIGAAAVLLLLIGFVFWKTGLAPAKAKALRPVIAELEAYKAKNGVYPSDPRDLASVKALRKVHRRLYFGKIDGGEVVWYPHDVSAHEFTILCDPKGYEFFLPVGKIKPWSISSFPVYRYHSLTQRWQKGRIMWTIHAGSYWYQR